jgi:hypothetical protein
MRRGLVPTVLAAVAVALLLVPASAGRQQTLPRVTVLGDSVAAAITLVPAARRALTSGLDARLDLRVCRRLAQVGCPYRGERPPSALDAIRTAGAGVGRTVVIDVGHNDVPTEYASDLELTMQALVALRVETVIWVPLIEDRPGYREINAAIRGAAARWPQLEIADWNAYSRGRRAWFAEDGLHLSARGATALARFLRSRIGAVVCGAACRHRADGSA